jgi:hypothetical protein
LFDSVGPEPSDPLGRLREASEADYYTAKRKAAAVLGHRVRPGDLPSDAEVREELLALAKSRQGPSAPDEPPQPEPDHEAAPVVMADHIDRFAIYKMRLDPLEAVKQNPHRHPEGDALYHCLQVFERAREARPYDEKGISQKARRAIEGSELIDDLKLLRDVDDAGRVPGALVGTVDEALAYLKGLEDEAYLDDE